jgi:hypothetical protein
MKKEIERDGPPAPPEQPRRLLFGPVQAIGVPLLMVLPLLAMVGLLATKSVVQTAVADEVRLEVEYPVRMAHSAVQPIRLVLYNDDGHPLRDVHVEVDRSYLDGFSERSFTPSLETVDASAYRAPLGHVAGRNSAAISGDVKANSSGPHEGEVRVFSGDRLLLRQRLRTFVLP